MGHGGNIYRFAERLGCLPEQVLDFSSNINPEQAVDLSCLHDVKLTPYADPDYGLLKQAIKQRYPAPAGADMEVFNGASAAIFALLRSLQPKDLVLYAPLYGEYAHIAGELGCTVQNIDRFSGNLTADVSQHSTVIFVNPSTPDGRLYEMQELLAMWQAADCTIIIDESFLDFGKTDSVAERIADYDKLYVIKSLSKFYGCAGIRIGFIQASATAIKQLKRFEPAWKLSSLDMAYMQQALANTAFIAQTRQQTAYWRDLLHQALQESGLFDKIYPGQANFLLARLKNGEDGHQLQTQLEPARILIRVCDNFAGLDKSHVRFAVKDEQAIARLSDSFRNIN
ncbi:aminotransferase class I/II-fold pyridoxal phosphate-dependent enzyme [Candidatus Methylobacter oryzae]|uniref:Aminotransferase class I/II-fold pyridoxal phosphate-dependent enzyme n=1 Tax=Candidatus Methylobacter oryzae TaxID=2497749 RepID=A0ABY3C8U0_9GAMM|nr:aminotransferase class I/II-fold pyridoxal phosphate-dependent enzyme [Candidatus Methylobacter oryzae]TRW91987.1 aminotransferase class I/II-fold pyridoxal phosphate-dependent enzyme [Candidatus Methylobacter oryzae]